MSTPRAALAAGLVLALAAGAWLLWLRPSGEAVDAAGLPHADEALASPAVPGPRAPPAPLPPLDQPLRLVGADLRARADNGDAPAACRLAAESLRCEGAAQAVREAERALAQVESITSDEIRLQYRERLQASMANHTRTTGHCEGVAPLSAAEGVRYWRQAALAGHPPAMRHYAIGNAFRLRDIVGVARELETYHREAEGIAVRAARAGDLDLAVALGLGYLGPDHQEGFRPFLAQALRPDPARALAWLQAARAHPAIVALRADHALRRRLDAALEQATDLLPPDAPVPAPAALAWREGVVPGVQLSGGFGDIDPAACNDMRLPGG